jgi:hypothetical protein
LHFLSIKVDRLSSTSWNLLSGYGRLDQQGLSNYHKDRHWIGALAAVITIILELMFSMHSLASRIKYIGTRFWLIIAVVFAGSTDETTGLAENLAVGGRSLEGERHRWFPHFVIPFRYLDERCGVPEANFTQ